MKLTLMALTLASALGASAAHAADGIKVGVLTCKMDGLQNDIIYTKEKFACSFKPESGAEQKYTGTIKEFGVNLSFTKDNTLVWAVLAPSKDMVAPDILKGTYVGGTGQVELGAGASASVLIGGGKSSITLQPVSFSGMIGAGIAADLTKFELE